MKVGVAHVANGQIAGAGDLLSLLVGDEATSFASLLNLGAGEPAAGHRVDANQGKQGDRPKEKGSNKDQPSGIEDSKPGIPSNVLSSQTVPSVNLTQWQFEAGGIGTGAGEVPLPPPVPKAANDADAVQPSSSGARVQTATEAAVGRQPILNQDATQMLPAPALSGVEPVEPSKEAAPEDRNAGVTRPIAGLTDRGTGSAAAEPLSAAPSAGLINNSSTGNSSGGFADNLVLPLTLPTAMDPRLAGAQEMQRSAPSSPGTGPVRSNQNSSGIPVVRSGDAPAQDAPGQVKSSTPPQGAADQVSSSAAGGHGQSNAGDAHHGSSEAKEAVVVSRSLAPQTPQNGPLGALNQGGPVSGHPKTLDPTPSGPTREPLPTVPLRELPSPRVDDANTARLLGSAVRGDLRLGVQTEAFGRVTIQTSTQGGQLSAQLSLENAKESAALAAHLPSVEQRIVQQHGLNVSVRIAGDFAGGAGAASTGRDQSGSGRRDPERYHDEIVMRPGGIENGPSDGGRGVAPAVLGGVQLGLSKLDVTV